jgi:hypothetical protein
MLGCVLVAFLLGKTEGIRFSFTLGSVDGTLEGITLGCLEGFLLGTVIGCFPEGFPLGFVCSEGL